MKLTKPHIESAKDEVYWSTYDQISEHAINDVRDLDKYHVHDDLCVKVYDLVCDQILNPVYWQVSKL